MAAALVCAVTAAALSLSSDRSQHFTIDGFTVTCPSASWSVHRSTFTDPSPAQCSKPWGRPKGAGCLVGPALPSDSGHYWCQDQADPEQCSPAVNITVSERTVILESPLFPVTEGQNVTLKCFYRKEEHLKSTSDFKAAFFVNNVFRGRFPGGTMVLSHVSKKDEGLYKCEHPSEAQSLESQLIVQPEERPLPPAPSPPPRGEIEISLYRVLCFSFLFLLYTTILCIGLCIYCRWARARVEAKQRGADVVL